MPENTKCLEPPFSKQPSVNDLSRYKSLGALSAAFKKKNTGYREARPVNLILTKVPKSHAFRREAPKRKP